MNAIVKRCGCGIEYTQAEWATLPYVGEIDDGVERLELRNCTCESTIAIVLETRPESDADAA